MRSIKTGFVLPRGDAKQVMALAVVAEQAGWDGLFVWEPVWGIDAWVCLAAAAVRTERILLGTLLSPLSRMRPWKVASETATLDNLSDGRLVLSVGLGAPDTGFAEFGEVVPVRERSELMDESLAIIKGLWAGQPFNFKGKHYTLLESDFVPPPPPVNGQVPIWIVGLWPNKRSMARAIDYQGILPSVRAEDGGFRALVPDDVRLLRQFCVDHNRAETDIIVESEVSELTRGERGVRLDSWREAGATWVIESLWQPQFEPDIIERVTRLLESGPPA